MSAVFSLHKYHHYTFAFIFAMLLAAYFITGNEVLFAGLGILLIFSASFLFSFVSSGWLLGFLALVIPFSVETGIGSSGLKIFFPSELLTGIFAGTALIKMFRKFPEKKFLLHPVTLLMSIYFLLTVCTIFFSTMPVVSLKAVFVKGIYFFVFYFLAYDAYRNSFLKSSLIFITCYGISITLIVLYALNHFAEWDYAKDAADMAVHPFYKDHTIYSACVAFILPVMAFFALKKHPGKKFYRNIIFSIIFILVGAGLVYSFSRAAWISILAAGVFAIVLFFKIRPFTLLIFSGLILFFISFYSERFLITLKKNKNDSNMRNADLETQTKSIVNISTDQSNAERLNRWKCALRMFDNKPFTGSGSGTYMYKYFDFQRKADMTYISVTSPYNTKPGHGGSVHSEYLQVLSENGMITFIAFMMLLLKIIFTGMKNAYDHPEGNKKKEAMVLTLALVTYLVHGLFNNFLDTDKVAFIFWSSVCMIVMIDLSRKQHAAH
ncbi:MAG TPA: O-antigen ligase family protein [Bacteroidia bacterium]|nr:O-antigen ligase family protein [Bacteroidia bacterium]